MLLEELVDKSQRKAEYDWETYYRWYFSQLAGHEVSGYTSWMCKNCLTVNVTSLPTRYGKCRNCELIHLPIEVTAGPKDASDDPAH